MAGEGGYNAKGTPGNYAGQTRYPLCKDCNLFHSIETGKCKFWDKQQKIFKTKEYLKHRSARKVLEDGSSIVNPFWIQKLEKFCFPHIGVTEEGKKKILKSLEEEVAKWPTASAQERRDYAEKHKKIVSLCQSEESRRPNAPSAGRIVNLAKEMIKPKEKTKKPKKSKEDEPLPELVSDSSSDEEDDSEGSH